MDVGNPSNFVRVLELFQDEIPRLENIFSSVSITDKETADTIAEVFRQYRYTLDPHGAVGYLALETWLENHPGQKGIFLETAHPIKFPEAVEKYTGSALTMPESMQGILDKKKVSTRMTANYSSLKDFLMSRPEIIVQ